MEKSHLDIMLGHYNAGAYLDTLLDLMCQQSDMTRNQLTMLLHEMGINFKVVVRYFKLDGEWVRAKSMDNIILSQTGKP